MRALVIYDDALIAGGTFGFAGEDPVSNIAAWDGSSWSALGTGLDGTMTSLLAHDHKLVAGFSTSGGQEVNGIAAWDGTSWTALGSGIGRLETLGADVAAMGRYHGNLIAGGYFRLAGGKLSLYLAEWTKHETVEASLDVRPGSCPNPVNGNNGHGRGRAVVPAAILGTADFDVRDIDPASVTLNGVPAVRWSYEDVGTPAGKSEGNCACSGVGPDGYEDLTLEFYSAGIVATLSASDAGSGAGMPGHDSYAVSAEGQLEDGPYFEASDCVVLVGNQRP